MAGKDNNKDQSYFLCQLSQDQLSKALFPIGELTKPEVREIAKEIGLVTAEKKDSQGLCFIGKVRLPEFLKQQLQPKEGEIVEIFKDFNAFHQEKPVFSTKVEELEYLSAKIQYKKAICGDIEQSKITEVLNKEKQLLLDFEIGLRYKKIIPYSV